VSEVYGGRTTAQIKTSSNFLFLLEPGDLVLADKGFPQIKTFLDDSGKGALLVIFAKRSFYCDGVKETQTMIHIERIMQKLKRFHIMSKFTISSLPFHVL
jgi:hypothetical protein